MPQLLGPDGRPVDLAKLREEEAAPTVTGLRSILGGHPAQGLTPQRLAELLREAEEGDATRYLELAEEMEEKDLHYLGVMGTRKRAIAQLEVTVEPASDSADDKANAELVETFLDRDELEDELFDVLDAIGKGYSSTEIVWDTSERQWMPARLEWRFPQWFEFDRVDGHTLMLRTEAGPEPLTPFKYIRHTHKAKSGLPIRGGLARAAAWSYLFKNYDIKDWVAFAEVYGQPLRVGKYHGGATEADKKTLLKAVANIGSDAAAIIPSSMLIEFVKAEQRGSVDLYQGLAEYLDKQVSKAVLGQTLTTEVKGGSLAAAQVHDAVREDIERSDAKQLAATLNRDLVRPIIDLNRGPQKAYPKIRIGRSEQVDIEGMSDALAKLVPLGLKVSQSQVRGKIGFDEPDDDSDLLQSRASEPPLGTLPGTLPGTPPGASDGTAAARHGGAGIDDSIEDLAGELLDDDAWEPLLRPFADDVRRLLAEVSSLEEFRARLAEALGGDNTEAFVDALSRALFQANLAGQVAAPLTDEEPPV